MQDHELAEWLGDTETTDDQRDALLRAADLIDARYPGEDLKAEAGDAFSAAAQIILGDETLEHVAESWKAAKVAERDAMVSLTGAIIAASLDQTERQISTSIDLNRLTVRKALGK